VTYFKRAVDHGHVSAHVALSSVMRKGSASRRMLGLWRCFSRVRRKWAVTRASGATEWRF
jgi:hypothetical protein